MQIMQICLHQQGCLSDNLWTDVEEKSAERFSKPCSIFLSLFILPNEIEEMKNRLELASKVQSTHLSYSGRYLREHEEGQRLLRDLTRCLLSKKLSKFTDLTRTQPSLQQNTQLRCMWCTYGQGQENKGKNKACSLPTEGVIIKPTSKVLTRV